MQGAQSCYTSNLTLHRQASEGLVNLRGNNSHIQTLTKAQIILHTDSPVCNTEYKYLISIMYLHGLSTQNKFLSTLSNVSLLRD